MNEVELLITVTPELVEALDANQVPPCGPGMETAAPSDWELFFKGHLEVPVCCYNGGNAGGALRAGRVQRPRPSGPRRPPPDIGACRRAPSARRRRRRQPEQPLRPAQSEQFQPR